VVGEYVSINGFGFVILLSELPGIEKLDLESFVLCCDLCELLSGFVAVACLSRTD
jgi:hypothetical protein